ncbi:glycogen debranching protein GlgX [Salmonella enterica]|uniref:glycogen debranching protein GlgX n=1 Tax=Salmonella enterica TaxID=28901 RepID=UPI00092EC5BD|nr:glycogen debranching protein GlgX [Salmonella enterica]
MIPTATYRLQFRNGMTFDRAAALVPYLKNLGISHLYASPIFTATKASTHGYDVTDANEIEPSIGGREGFERLVAELKAQGLGLIIDIVPNHMASSLENAWWRDVLEYGKESRYARHFDIDWSRRLTLPFLGDTFDAVLENGEIAIKPDPATGKPAFAYYDNYYPLAPATRYYGPKGIQGFRDMVRAFHDAGVEVILDVVYNHTAEGNELGPTLSFKGIDNFSYYRTMPDQHRYYINDTGTGNTVNTSHPRVLQMVMDSLRYWAESMHVDGFRFDLGTILGREPEGFDQRGGFFDAVTQDPVLAKLKLIGEPWDIGPGGYQVGGFPPGWGEWNDKYRDTVREYWKGDNVTNDFAARLLGSGDLYDLRGRRPWSSVNFITAHDGFTLNDLVSYNDKHNEANGEDNNDGHNDNRSCNYGAEGPTDDEGINAIRERQKRNFLTTLLFSHGTPMLLAGDEFGRSQMGNNNGYCQDSEISWVHWDNLPETANALREFTRHLIQLRATQPLLRRESWRDGLEIRWFNAGGGAQQSEQWDEGSTIGVCISRPDLQPEAGIWHDALLLFNPFEGSVPFRIPMWGEGGWVLELTTADNAQQGIRITEEMDFDLAGRSIVLFRRP